MKFAHSMPFGATVLNGAGVSFALWAPGLDQVALEHGSGASARAHPMARNKDGWHRLTLPGAQAGDRYRYILPGGTRVPDPASRFNPDDVHGASQVVDPQAYAWQHDAWRGRRWEEAVIYELHIGTFTPEGTFAAAQTRLAALAELGITAVELMPVADFAGRRNWGYDGVLPFAPDASYGTPDELKALIDAAHGLGLMMLLDVVYNHFGPEGNYLHSCCPHFFNPAHQTPWGAAINYDGLESRTVRDFFIHNALYWVEEFNFDGLRMDAIHALRDDSEPDIVREICAALHAGPGRERQVHVVLENDANRASYLERDERGLPLAATAQWNDDLHHAVHVLTTGETDGYFADYANAPLAQFGRALTQGFIFQGQPSVFRAGERRGEPSAHLPLSAFVSFLQSHDQVGNRALGERIHTLADPALLRAAYACVLLSPHTPMLFMGEEFAASTPFQYFCDFGPELAQAVSRGRRAEFARFAAFASEAAQAQIPDPNLEATFLASKLRWQERDTEPHKSWLAEVRQLLHLRQQRLVPLLTGRPGSARFRCDGETLRLEWTLAPAPAATGPGPRLHLLAHFGLQAVDGVAAMLGEVLYAVGVGPGSGAATLRLAPGAVQVTLQQPDLLSVPWTDSTTATLHDLCAHFGIATAYDDIWGTRQEIASESLIALLREFDVVLDSPASARDALAAAQRATWQQALPPVLAIQGSAPEWSLSLRLPAAATTIRWQVLDETGERMGGEVDTAALPEVARIELDGVPWCERKLTLALRLPAGYHRLSVQGVSGETLIISAPEHGYRPSALQDGGRVWGPAVQLYALRSKRNWGIGDFGDLAHLIGQMAERGADVIGLNPLHALYAHNPAHASPYSPSSREQLNVLYIDVEAVDDFAVCEPARRLVLAPEFQARLAVLREAPMVDYRGVAAAKFETLELLFAHFREHHLSIDGAQARDDAGRAFLDFAAQRGKALYRHALFEALQAHFHQIDNSIWGWPMWPEAYRDPTSAEVSSFAQQHRARVQYHQYLQWLAARQLARASDQCQALGLGVGLYLDLAVSADRGGSDAWSERNSFAIQASVGAPPDEFNPNGQGWGLPPLRPDRLRASHYRYFIDTLRANMRGAGALRIDHVMGLMRLFWIPPGQTARDGAYVHYALDEMLSIVALESQRNRCLVIGEDLGTVAPEMRAAMERFDVLSYRLLYFERQDGGDFKPASDYPANALVAVSTHDLATLAGWWGGQDLRLRLQLGLYPDLQIFEKQLLDRAQERVRLLLALQREQLLSPVQLAEAASEQDLPGHVVEAIHAFLARTPCAVMMLQLEDVLGVRDQANMPGTTDEHPNWQRKLPLDLQALAAHAAMLNLGRTLAALRPRHSGLLLERDSAQARIPRATYRLQFHKNFGFAEAIRILPYLARLGVSHVYCSPIQRARPGSTHGYDVMAHDEVNPELGGREGFDRFSAALRERGMGMLLDLVPNHMGVLGGDNAWWMDVLENGPASLYAQHFDIDWQPLNPELTGKVLLPVLGNHYGDVLLSGQIVLHFEASAGSLALRYVDHRFALAPESYVGVLVRAQGRLADVDLAASLASIATALSHLPARDTDDRAARAERSRDKELLKARLARLAARQPAVAQAITATVAELNLGGARDDLHALIEAQPYRLAYWRVAADDINYRRFFDINELAALRMERDDVFEATQSFALDLAAAGIVDGLRIDHPDGLYDPARYFAQLQAGYARRAGLILPDTDADGRPARPLYVVAEKIAAIHEEVPESWHIHGMTGYRFTNLSNGIFVDPSAAGKFKSIWHNFTGNSDEFEEIAHAGKRDIIRTALASELNALSTELLRIARADLRTRDYTLNALRRALTEVAACMPVYRTYFIDTASPQDRHYVDWAVREARHYSQDADLSIFSFVHQTLLGDAVPDVLESLRERVRRFAIRFQQFSAPVAAKGVEDTAFYRYFPLSSLNEVGGDPALFGVTVADFHTASAFRADHWPHTMVATSTHDNKRSEDVRNRINVLSEMPARWRLALRHWRALNRSIRHKLEAAGAPAGAPSHADEYLLYQTLLGTLPAAGLSAATREPYCERIVEYMRKAARESKLHTRWTQPDEAYEGALEGFVRAVLRRQDGNRFVAELQALGATLAWFGALNSLSMTLLKFTSPGVPDLYQGHEVINLTLVDPDNRRSVDYAALDQTLQALEALDPAQVSTLMLTPHDGRAKLWITWRLLTLRRERPALFRDGDYRALEVSGAHAEHVVAFARRHEGATLVALSGRLFFRLLGEADRPPLGEAGWFDTRVALDLPDGTRLTNVLTHETLVVEHGHIALGAAFARLPTAALVTQT